MPPFNEQWPLLSSRQRSGGGIFFSTLNVLGITVRSHGCGRSDLSFLPSSLDALSLLFGRCSFPSCHHYYFFPANIKLVRLTERDHVPASGPSVLSILVFLITTLLVFIVPFPVIYFPHTHWLLVLWRNELCTCGIFFPSLFSFDVFLSQIPLSTYSFFPPVTWTGKQSQWRTTKQRSSCLVRTTLRGSSSLKTRIM